MNIKQLEAEIQKHNNLYWNENAPIISDQEYDLLVEQLKQLNPNSPVLTEIPENNYGTPVTHKIPMLSMDKAYDLKTIKSWAKKMTCKTFVASAKMDGSACSIIYKDGVLIEASTRGNGQVGEDVTENVKQIANVPLTLPNLTSANGNRNISLKSGIVEIRGEVIMPLSVFKKYKDTNSNPRNMAAGSLKQKDPQVTKERNLKFYAYKSLTRLNESESFRMLEDMGFTTAPYMLCDEQGFEEAYNYFNGKRDEYDFELDGVIFTIDDIKEQESLGNTSHHPRCSLAWKFQGETSTTKLIDIEWSVSKTGVITPVAIVEPVNLSGAMVTKASIHHANFVKAKGFTKNCIVEMCRRGMVIPHIERVVSAGNGSFEIPAKCPSCGANTEMRSDFLFCTSSDCGDQTIGKIENFIKVCEIDGLGRSLITQLYETGLVSEFSDLYTLTKEKILGNMDRVGDKTAENILSEIDKKRTLPLNVFLRSLNISELGKKMSSLLAKEFETLDKVRSIKVSDIESIDGVGPIISSKIVSGLLESSEIIDNLLKYVTVVDMPKQVIGVLNGKSFVFTGTLSVDRKEAQKKVIALGGECPSSVGKDLSYLVCGEGADGSSKYKKAEKYGVSIITEDSFWKMIG